MSPVGSFMNVVSGNIKIVEGEIPQKTTKQKKIDTDGCRQKGKNEEI